MAWRTAHVRFRWKSGHGESSTLLSANPSTVARIYHWVIEVIAPSNPMLRNLY